ncbi:uncharacterized protein LOC134245511 [Saccostrea cucullata]|uniref:uncharacterized protein LOC134245511 n=1 Tax=Saccostrea cuccullata TaxID=36930 RepID=UPI002ED1B497
MPYVTNYVIMRLRKQKERKKERAECFQLHIFCTVTCHHKDQISSTRVVLTPKFSQFVKSTSSDTREECGVNANKGSTAGVYLTSRQFLVITIRMTNSEEKTNFKVTFMHW